MNDTYPKNHHHPLLPPPPSTPPPPPHTTTITTTTTTRVAVQTRGMVVQNFVSCAVRHRVNLSGLPILMASPADGPHEGGMRRREGARARRERRQRAEAHLRLRLVRDAAMLLAHRGGPRFDSQSKFVKEGAVREPVLVSGLMKPSSGVMGPFKHLHVAAQSPWAGAAPLLGDVFSTSPVGKVEGLVAVTCFCSCDSSRGCALRSFFCPGII